MNLLIVKTNQPYMKEEAVPISDEELQKRLKANTVRLLEGTVYEEVDPSEYATKVMRPRKTTARKKTTAKKPRGRSKSKTAKKT